MTRDKGIHPSSLTKKSFITKKKYYKFTEAFNFYLFITKLHYVQCNVTFVYINFLEYLGDSTYANICCRLSRIIFLMIYLIYFHQKINIIYTLDIIWHSKPNCLLHSNIDFSFKNKDIGFSYITQIKHLTLIHFKRLS